MNKNQWLSKLHELAFDDTRLDKIPFVCFEALAEGIAKIQASEQRLFPSCFTCGHNLDSDGICTNEYCAGPFTAGE